MARVTHSAGHPNLESVREPSRTAKARRSITGKAAAAKQRKSPRLEKKKKKLAPTKVRLTQVELGHFIYKHNIESYADLEALAQQRSANGEFDIFNFIAAKERCVSEALIKRMKSMRDAETRQADAHLTRMEKLKRALQLPCVAGCDGRWALYAADIFEQSGYTVLEGATAFRRAIEHGRKKENNVILIGERDCGKTFLVDPLESIFRTFSSPTKGRFSWVEIEGKEVNNLIYHCYITNG